MQFSTIDVDIENVSISMFKFENIMCRFCKSILQMRFKSLYIEIAKIDLKLKYAKQKSNQFVNKIISYIKKIRNTIV